MPWPVSSWQTLKPRPVTARSTARRSPDAAPARAAAMPCAAPLAAAIRARALADVADPDRDAGVGGEAVELARRRA